MNIVLIGMPTCGKSTVGVLLAKSAGYAFCDTDLVIQSKHKKLLCDIIKEVGTDGFLSVEENALLALECDNTVIATGGSAVYGEAGMEHLRRGAITVYLRVSEAVIEQRLVDITSRGVVMPEGMTLADVYAQRVPLYEKYADITLECDGLSAEECVNGIISRIGRWKG